MSDELDKQISDDTTRSCMLILLLVLAVVLAGGVLGWMAYRGMGGG
mgnify:CR=1 FL=1